MHLILDEKFLGAGAAVILFLVGGGGAIFYYCTRRTPIQQESEENPPQEVGGVTWAPTCSCGNNTCLFCSGRAEGRTEQPAGGSTPLTVPPEKKQEVSVQNQTDTTVQTGGPNENESAASIDAQELPESPSTVEEILVDYCSSSVSTLLYLFYLHRIFVFFRSNPTLALSVARIRIRIGIGIGIGNVFSSLIQSVSRSPSLGKQLFGYFKFKAFMKRVINNQCLVRHFQSLFGVFFFPSLVFCSVIFRIAFLFILCCFLTWLEGSSPLEPVVSFCSGNSASSSELTTYESPLSELSSNESIGW